MTVVKLTTDFTCYVDVDQLLQVSEQDLDKHLYLGIGRKV